MVSFLHFKTWGLGLVSLGSIPEFNNFLHYLTDFTYHLTAETCKNKNDLLSRKFFTTPLIERPGRGGLEGILILCGTCNTLEQLHRPGKIENEFPVILVVNPRPQSSLAVHIPCPQFMFYLSGSIFLNLWFNT